MKKLYFLLLAFFIIHHVSGQTYGNEWINYNQKYYSFPLVQNGIYRIDYSTLSAAGIPLSTINSNQFQLFGKDKEIPLLMEDGGDNTFDSGDYFLFYGERNDGWADSLIYPDPSTMANPGYSLVNDTIYYFFTWTNTGTGLRFTPQTNTNTASFTPEPFVTGKTKSAFNNSYAEGELYDKASGSVYAKGEGFGYAELATDYGNVYYDIGFLTPALYTGAGAPNAQIHFRVSSNSSMHIPNLMDHHVKVSVGSSLLTLVDTSYQGYKQTIRTKNVPVSALNSGISYLRHEIVWDLGPSVLIDRQILTYIEANYPRLTNSSASILDRFRVSNTGNGFARIDLSNFGGSQPVVLSYGNQLTYQYPILNGSVYPFLIPDNATGNSSEIIVGNVANAISISVIQAVNGTGIFTDLTSNNYESALLFITHPSLQNGTNDYKTYRQSAAGGAYNVISANIRELYFQYGGGIKMHPAAIRRYVKYAYDVAATKPVGLFLIGKGYDVLTTRNNSLASDFCLIPPLGYPASDVALTSAMNGHLWDPLVPTGRISVLTENDLNNYLNKVIAYENDQNPGLNNFQDVMDGHKQILHFVGGANAQQQAIFQNYMNGMRLIAQDTVFAGNVTSYFKTSSAPLDPNVVTGVTNQIANGVSLMTFLSHAAASNNGFELNIDAPANWNNVGKYPFVIGLSCYNGNIFSGIESASEKFVNAVNSGSVNFLSTISVGYDGPLAMYGQELYRQFSYKNYGKTYGEQIKHTIEYMEPIYQSFTNGYSILYEATCSQMTLNGDPMLKMNFSTAPEIDITAQDLSLTPTNVNLSTDSIALKISIRNLGTSIKTPVSVQIKRDFPGTTVDSIYTFALPRLNYDTTFTKKFPLQGEISAGVNNFTVSVDIPSIYPEQFEEIQNNQATASFFLNIDGMLPIWPYNYAVVPYDTVTVKASTINPIASWKTYRFELDTTDTYDSPQLRRFSVSGLGGVKYVEPDQWLSSTGSPFPLICTDSTVYFWRVAVDSTIPQWAEFSFQYIPGKRGWGQDHFFQFKNNSFSSIDYDRTDRQRKFLFNDIHSIKLIVMQTTDAWASLYNVFQIDGETMDYATCGYNPYLYVGVVDAQTLEAWKTHCPGCGGPNNDPSMNFGNVNNLGINGGGGCRDRYEYYFTFNQTDATSMANFQNMIENGVPDSNYVVIYSPFTTYFDQMNTVAPSVFTMFSNLGFPTLNSSQPNAPFSVIFKKGTTAYNTLKLWSDAIPTNDVPAGVPKISSEITVVKPSNAGVEKTPFIGPSFEWQTIYWRRDSLESPTTDSVRLYIEKYDVNQGFAGKIDTVYSPNDSILNLNSLVDAQLYPWIKIGIYNSDKISQTPAQIDRLHVLYSPVPEAAIDGTNGYYSSHGDTIFEGQTFSFAIDVVNVSDYDMDSLLIDYWLEDQYHIKHVIPYPRQDSLISHFVLRDTITFPSVGTPGYNVLWMEVNPYINGSTVRTDQLEQYHYNNILQLPVFVVGDDENPILDVTFNGKHILNGDIIDPNSEILITLKDDNQYLIMNDVSDTTLFGIYLTGPDGIQKRIPFIDGQGNTIMQWIPANNTDMKFKIVYPKEFLVDGAYQLSVQGTDRSGNLSGDFAYKVNFEVIRESSITHMMNYPNPFSTSTRFVFTLTGTEEPDDIIIRIMTVSGRVVREINEDELGKIVIGRNITEFAWDGTDEFGDPLANGVYLYEVKVRINGEEIKHRESGADQYFKKDFGKMYLLR